MTKYFPCLSVLCTFRSRPHSACRCESPLSHSDDSYLPHYESGSGWELLSLHMPWLPVWPTSPSCTLFSSFIVPYYTRIHIFTYHIFTYDDDSHQPHYESSQWLAYLPIPALVPSRCNAFLNNKNLQCEQCSTKTLALNIHNIKRG